MHRFSRRLPMAASALALAALLAASSVAVAAPSVAWEVNVSANLLGKRFPNNNASEPVVAVDPRDAGNVAATYNTRGAKCGISPGVRISRDGGQTWKDAARKPWAGSGRYPNWHAAVAWGPGPTAGKSRLYWADTTLSDCSFSDHRLSVAYSDDLGATWSPLFVYKGSAATPFGGYPDITVDNNPASPRYGTVYAAINWFARSADEPGYRLLASSDFGKTWAATEVPALPAAAGYRFRYRIGYRLRTGPDGSLYASFCQRDRASPSGATGRLAFGISRVTFDASSNSLNARPAVLATTVKANGFNLGTKVAPGTRDRLRLATCYLHGLDVDQSNGDVFMAVGNFIAKQPVGTARGRVSVGRSTDKGQTWGWKNVPPLPLVGGRAQSAHKPTLLADGGSVFVGFHALVDVPLGTGTSPQATVANAYAVSYDRGSSFTVSLISPSRWHPDWLDYSRNASGIRDRAELAGPGTVIYVYGDGRHAAAKPSALWGRGQVYAASIKLGKP